MKKHKDKNFNIIIKFDDRDENFSKDVNNNVFYKKDYASYEKWKNSAKDKKNKDKISYPDFLNFFSAQKYKYDKLYGAADIIIFTDKNIQDYLEYSEYYITDFIGDRLVIVGRRKIEKVEDINGYNISITNPQKIIGEITYSVILDTIKYDNLIEKIKYCEDSVIAMQDVDLYNCDYAIIGRIPSKMAKNSFVSNQIPLYLAPVIRYKIAYKKSENKAVENFYNFLCSDEIEKIYNNYLKK